MLLWYLLSEYGPVLGVLPYYTSDSGVLPGGKGRWEDGLTIITCLSQVAQPQSPSYVDLAGFPDRSADLLEGASRSANPDSLRCLLQLNTGFRKPERSTGPGPVHVSESQYILDVAGILGDGRGTPVSGPGYMVCSEFLSIPF